MKGLALVLLASTVLGTVVFNPLIASAGEVANRLENQQNRIHQGVKDGQINHQEYKNLEHCEANINKQRLADLKKDGGHLTAKDYRQLNREENRVSNAIYRDRHN